MEVNCCLHFPSRSEQGLWKLYGRPRGSSDAPELFPAAPAGPHRGLQPPRTQPHQRTDSISHPSANSESLQPA